MPLTKNGNTQNKFNLFLIYILNICLKLMNTSRKSKKKNVEKNTVCKLIEIRSNIALGLTKYIQMHIFIYALHTVTEETKKCICKIENILKRRSEQLMQ